MMLKVFLFTFLITFNLIAQDNNVSDEFLQIEYTHSIHVKGAPYATVVNATLRANAYTALYEMDFMGDKNFTDQEDSEVGPILRIKPKNNDFVYKDYKNKHFYSIMRVSMKPFLVKDSMSIFNWKIENEFKDIIGYKCQKATAEYRGRTYVAFFTTATPFNNAPWKFANLPGLILEVYSTDKVLEIIANKLEIKNQSTIIENPYEKDLKNSISWNDFIAEYKKKHDEMLHFRGPNNSTMSIPKEGIEVYIE